LTPDCRLVKSERHALLLSSPAGDDGGKLYYCRSNDQEHVVDLGRFHDEGELLIAADNRLAELLEWPELAEETTLLRR
jgi:hypothetical protein